MWQSKTVAGKFWGERVPSKRPIFTIGEDASPASIELDANQWRAVLDLTGPQFHSGIKDWNPTILVRSPAIHSTQPAINGNSGIIFWHSLNPESDCGVFHFSSLAASGSSSKHQGQAHSNDRTDRVSMRFLPRDVEIELDDITPVNGASI